MRRIALALFAALGILFCTAALAQSVLDQAKKLMNEGKAQEAFTLLAPLEPQRAGEIDFDYTFGIAALDSGRPDRATIALERVLATNPDFAGARIDLGRAYFAMGSDDLARSEFETVLRQSPPENVKPLIARYLQAIEARSRRNRPVLAGYLEAGVGTDSNITAVTSNFAAGVQQAYSNILALTATAPEPTGNSIKRDGWFSQAAAGAEYAAPIEASALSWYLGGDLRDRRYHDDNAAFSYQQGDARTGVALALERDLLRVGVQTQAYFQEAATPLGADGTRITNDRRTWGYTGEWRRGLGGGRQAGLFVQLNEQNFLSNRPQNVNQTLVGGQFLQAWERKGNPLVMLAAFHSVDRATGPLNAAGTTNVSKTVLGVRALGQYTLRENIDVYATVGHTEREDDSQFARSTVVEYGDDRLFDVTLGVNWRLRPTWSLRSYWSFYDNRSNLALYEYKRTEVGVFLRKDFR